MTNITIANYSFVSVYNTCMKYNLTLQKCVIDITSKELKSLYNGATQNLSIMSRTIGIKTNESPELDAEYIQMLNKTALRNQTLYFLKSETLLTYEKMMREHITLMYDAEDQYKEITHLRTIVTYGNDMLQNIRAEQKEMRSNIYNSNDKIQTLKMVKPVLYNAALYALHTKKTGPTERDYYFLQHDEIMMNILEEMKIKEKYAEKFTDVNTLTKEHYSKVMELQGIIHHLLTLPPIMILIYDSMCKIHEELAVESMTLLQLKIKEQVMRMQLTAIEKEYSDVYALTIKSADLKYNGILGDVHEFSEHIVHLLLQPIMNVNAYGKMAKEAIVDMLSTKSTEHEKAHNASLLVNKTDEVNDMQTKHLQNVTNDSSHDALNYEESALNDTSSNVTMHNEL
ncbi:hypothetical protein Fsol_00082 [Candidatus Fokinia solitaria]|uniref:Uncharacterized protein n=1 Tax=Candidatus Fokinia solitaria TaxID=1802984 RepID=A0A2U8BRC8_9RICK|nr:hypothetical protein [Candidatus Fokinia solitaria]AWD32895.1 hypothetical protein Fsol_00082 [Candidatus Fokinia solitaria]